MPATYPMLTQQQTLWRANTAAALASIDGSQRLARLQWDLLQRWGNQTGQIVLDTVERSSAAFAERALEWQRSLEAPADGAGTSSQDRGAFAMRPAAPERATMISNPMFDATQAFLEMATSLSRVMRDASESMHR